MTPSPADNDAARARVEPQPRADKSARSVRLVAFDLDGVVYRGSELLPGAVDVLQSVRERGFSVRFVTNNSTLHRRDVAAKLSDMGVAAAPGEVLTSAAATAAWVAQRLDGSGVLLAIGEAGLLEELTEAGFDAVHAGRAEEGHVAEAVGVVVGLDRAFDYDALSAAQQVLLRGGLFVATNGDATFPAEDGLRPGAGAVVAAVAAAAGMDPTVIGKPNSGLAEALAASAEVSAEETVFVGDRLETDIAFARRAGMGAVLVLTGVTDRTDLADAAVQPDAVLDDLRGLPDLLERWT